MFLGAVGSFLLDNVVFSEMCNACRLTLHTTVQNTPDLNIVLPCESRGSVAALTYFPPSHLFCSSLETRTGQFRRTNTANSPHWLRCLWKPNAEMKTERTSTWAIYRPASLLLVAAYLSGPFIHVTVCMEVCRRRKDPSMKFGFISSVHACLTNDSHFLHQSRQTQAFSAA